LRPMIHSKKHYVQESIGTTTAGSVTSIDIALSVAPDVEAAVNHVLEGSSIKAVFVEMWLRSAAAAGSSGQLIVYKLQGGANSPTATEMAALGDWDNKKNIFYTTMGLFNNVDSLATPSVRQWIKIPRSKQRMGLGDQIRMSFLATGQTLNHCGFFTYKEYT